MERMLFLIELTDILSSAKSSENAARTTADVVTPMKQATSDPGYPHSWRTAPAVFHA
jgi:hypothetical protein